MTLECHERFPDGTFPHGPPQRDGRKIFAVSGCRSDAFVQTMPASSLEGARPTMSYGVNLGNPEDVKKAYDMCVANRP